MEVANKRVVSIRYIMKNRKGEVLENGLESAPVTYLHGVGNITPSLEANLLGLKVGDEKLFSISDEQSTPELNEEYSFKVIIDEVRLPTEEELNLGYPIPGKENCGPDCCC